MFHSCRKATKFNTTLDTKIGVLRRIVPDGAVSSRNFPHSFTG